MRLFSNRSQMTLKCGKNIGYTLGYRLVCDFFCSYTFWRHLRSITEQLHLYTRTRNLLVEKTFTTTLVVQLVCRVNYVFMSNVWWILYMYDFIVLIFQYSRRGTHICPRMETISR